MSRTKTPWYSQCSWDVGGPTLPEWIPFLTSIDCTTANLTHRIDGLVELELLKKHQQSSISWAIHLSSNHLQQVPLGTFLETVSAISPVRELLVVSGHPKPKRTSLTLIETLERLGNTIPLAVAVSPQDSVELVKQKLSFNSVQHIYIQLTEPQFATETLAQVRRLRPKIAVSACWMPPTKANWQALTMYPWKGSMLSEAWMESYSYAQDTAQKQLDWMKEENISPLIEPRRLTKNLISCIEEYQF